MGYTDAQYLAAKDSLRDEKGNLPAGWGPMVDKVLSGQSVTFKTTPTSYNNNTSKEVTIKPEFKTVAIPNVYNPVPQVYTPINNAPISTPVLNPIVQPTSNIPEQTAPKSLTGAMQNIQYGNIIGVVASVMVLNAILGLFRRK